MKSITLLVVAWSFCSWIQAQNQNSQQISTSLNEMYQIAQQVNQPGHSKGQSIETNADLIIKYNHGNSANSPYISNNGNVEWKLKLSYRNDLLEAVSRENTSKKVMDEKSTFEYNHQQQLITIRLFQFKGIYPYEVGRTELAYDTNGRRVKKVQFEGQEMIDGDSVQIEKRYGQFVSYSEYSGKNGWRKTKEISNINHNKNNGLISFTHKEWGSDGRLTVHEKFRNVRFIDAKLTEQSPLFSNKKLNNANQDLSDFDKLFNPDFEGNFLHQPIQYEKQEYSVITGNRQKFMVKKAYISHLNDGQEITMLTYDVKHQFPDDKEEFAVVLELPQLYETVRLDAENRIVRATQTMIDYRIVRDFTVQYNQWNMPENITQIVTSFDGIKESIVSHRHLLNIDDNRLKNLTIKKLTGNSFIDHVSVANYEFLYKSKHIQPDLKPVSGITVYPNPTSGWTNLYLPVTNVLTAPKIFVSTVGGVAVTPAEMKHSGNIVSINMQNFSPGIYLVTLELDGRKITEKIVRSK